jgi:indole-3-glycerol phosphate synthase
LPETQGSGSLPGILAEILETKRRELSALERRAGAMLRAAEDAPPPRDFRAPLARAGSVSLIAECKRRSPGAGPIRPDLVPGELAHAYESAGAAALSVLTDETYFGGSTRDLGDARGSVSIPVLRKDFTLDPLQVHEARAAGADAVLLIVRILSDDALGSLLRLSRSLGMAALVEVHDRGELDRALRAEADIIGVNNRDLATFTTDLDTTLRLVGVIPDDVVVVSESGIRGPADVRRLGDAGVDAVLVGESLLRAADPGAAAAELAGIPNGRRGHARHAARDVRTPG